ncbi:MAG TPA: hypothetical protein DDY13_02215 [Cytophagales bacterium]|jgi:hypothetical protein|nr:hypothetical protein [Cytophagales bacterium]
MDIMLIIKTERITPNLGIFFQIKSQIWPYVLLARVLGNLSDWHNFSYKREQKSICYFLQCAMISNQYIGYFFLVDGEVRLLTEIDISMVGKNPDLIKSIFVNDEWLERVGFSYLAGSSEYQTYTQSGVYVILSDYRTKFLDQYGMVQEFDYLHELQKLFYQTTGKELSISAKPEEGLSENDSDETLDKIKKFQSLNLNQLILGL